MPTTALWLICGSSKGTKGAISQVLEYVENDKKNMEDMNLGHAGENLQNHEPASGSYTKHTIDVVVGNINVNSVAVAGEEPASVSNSKTICQ